MNIVKKKLAYVATTAWPFNHHIKSYIDNFSEEYDIYLIFNNKEYKLVHYFSNITIINIDIKREINILYDLISLFKLLIIFKNNKFNIIHSITPKAGLLAMLAARMLNIDNRIHTFTGQVWINYSFYKKFIFKLIDSLIVNMSTYSLSDSKSQSDYLNKNLLLINKLVKVLENGSIAGISYCKDLNIFFDRYSLRGKYRVDNKFVVLFYGRINKDKGIFDFIEIARKLVNLDNIMFFICGPDEKDIIKNSKNIPSNVTIVEPVNHFSKIIPISDILLMPSYREGFGIVPLEAATYKIPTIGYNIIGLKDSILDKFTGYLFENGNIDSICDCIINLCNDRSRLNRIGQNAFNNLESFSQSKILNNLKIIYSKKI